MTVFIKTCSNLGRTVTKLNWVRQLTSIILVLLFSCAALGGQSLPLAGAVLHASGKVQVNGAGSRVVTALFPGDSIRTTENSVANIVADGSSVLVMPDSLVKFVGPGVELSEGGVSVSTSKEMAVTAGDLTISPAAQKQSKFEVATSEDLVVIAAREGDLSVADGQQTSTVPQGQESSRKKKKKSGGAAPAAGGGHALSGKTLAIVGGASGATVAGLLIAESNKKKKCVSASNNKKCKCTKDKNGNENCEEDN